MEAENVRSDGLRPSADLPVEDKPNYLGRSVLVQPVGGVPSAMEQSAEYWVDVLTQRPLGKSPRRCVKPECRPPAETAPATPGIMVGAVEAARICGISRTTWYSLKAAGRLPAPVHLGRRVLWRREELHDWMTARCPSLHQWQRLKEPHTTSSRKGQR